MDRQSNVILMASFFMAVIIIFVFNVWVLQISYNLFDYFGPFSVYPLALIAQFSLPILFIAILLKYRKFSSFYFLTPFLLLIVMKYVSIELAEPSYITSFYDSTAHFRRGLFVTLSGHSDSHVDIYFDHHPGFFWVTSILLNVCGTPASLVDSKSTFIVKWFPIFAIIAYIPILYIFYRRLLSNFRLVSVALLLHFVLDIIHFHYAAESYGRAIYWLFLLSTFILTNKRDIRYLFLALITGFSLVFVHEGLTIFAILTSAALVIYPAIFKIIAKDIRFVRREFFTLPLTLGVVWVSYLIYLTLHEFKSVIDEIRHVIVTLVTENVRVMYKGVSRADAAWMQIVSYKAIYISILILLGLILSFINVRRKRSEEDKLALTILVLSAIFFGTAAIGLGGAGYIERLPSLTLPIIAYSMVKYAFNFKPRRFSKFLAVVLLSILIFTSTAFYFSGRNFQSVTYSEYYSQAFLAVNSPKNTLNIYDGLRTKSIRDVLEAEMSNQTVTNVDVILVYRRAIFEAYYYTYADINLINGIIYNLCNQSSVIYNSQNAILILNVNSKS